MRVGLLVVIAFLPPSLLHGDDAPKPAAIKNLIQQLGDGDEAARAVATEKLRKHGYVVLPYLKAAFKRKDDLGERARELWLKIAGYDPRSVRSWGKPKQGTQIHPVFDLPVEVIHTRTKIELVLIPPGEFMMGGSKKYDKEAFLYKNGGNEERPHKVVIGRPCYVGKFEVTTGEWWVNTGESPSAWGGFSRPVESVSLEEILRFLERNDLRLLTEAEWEYACRAGTKGGRYGPIDEVAWTNRNRGRSAATHVVGTKKPNRFGLHDMLGNVTEWCGSSAKGYRVRGGSVRSSTFMVRATPRFPLDWKRKSPFLGFRVAHDP